jgi:hypothetical protein
MHPHGNSNVQLGVRISLHQTAMVPNVRDAARSCFRQPELGDFAHANSRLAKHRSHAGWGYGRFCVGDLCLQSVPVPVSALRPVLQADPLLCNRRRVKTL